MISNSRSALLAMVLLAGGAQAAPIASTSTQFDLMGLDGTRDTELSSLLDCDAGSCSITNKYTTSILDAQAKLSWTTANKDVILAGTLPYDFGANVITSGWNWTWVGVYLGTPNFSQFNGQADFTGSTGINAPCQASFICAATYLDFVTEAGNPTGGGELRAILSRLDSLFSLDDVRVEADENGDPGPEIVTPVVRFGSSVEPQAAGLQFTYFVTNLADRQVEFDVLALSWFGILQPLETATLTRLVPVAAARLASAAVPVARVVDTRVFVDNGLYSVSASFDMFRPVPVPASGYLLLSATLLLLRRSSRNRGARR